MARTLRDDSALCCCEYINEDGERSHLLAVCCNCEAVDEACERWITLKGVERTTSKIIKTFEDRLRIPWYRGAKKVPVAALGALCIVLGSLLLGSVSWVAAGITYIFMLPVTLFMVHRCIRGHTALDVTPSSGIGLTHSEMKKPRSQFYFLWLVTSLIFLLLIYYTQVLNYLKISMYENLLFMGFVCVSTTSLHLVRVSSCPGFVSPKKDAKDAGEVIESGAWRVCGACEKQVPRQASHCRTCDTCYLRRDHHCIWLDTCISQGNDRWFVVGLVAGLLALCYGAYLTFTTVCHPRLLNLHVFTILIPHQCPNAFTSLKSSLSMSAACYCLLLVACVTLALMQQAVCILCGLQLREYRVRRRQPTRSYHMAVVAAFNNCWRFWWRDTADGSTEW